MVAATREVEPAITDPTACPGFMQGHTAMNRSIRSTCPAAVGLILAVLAVAACGGTAAQPTSTPVPAATPDATPVAHEPTPVPTPGITFAPSIPLSTPGPDGVDGAVIALDVFLDHRVTLAFSDPDHLIVDAVTGHAKDGMSVGRGETIVRNVDPKTVEVTWSGLSGDEAISLVAKPQGTGVLLQFGEQVPPVNSDAMGADRVAVLTFANPVDAADIVTDFPAAGD